MPIDYGHAYAADYAKVLLNINLQWFNDKVATLPVILIRGKNLVIVNGYKLL